MPGLTKRSYSVTTAKAKLPAEADVPSGPLKAPGVLLAPGAGGGLGTPGLVALSEAIAASGRPSVRFDMEYRALGRRSPPAAEKSDGGFPAVLEHVRQDLGLDSWVVGGRSYGGRVASLLVAGGILPAAGLILYSYPLHRTGDVSRLRVDHWPRITVPCLFLVVTNDPFCRFEAFESSLRHLGGQASVIEVRGGGHGLAVKRAASPDGKGRGESTVIAEVQGQIHAWLAGLDP